MASNEPLITRESSLQAVLERARKRDWVVGSVAALLAVAALVVGSTGSLHPHPDHLEPKLRAGISAAALLVFGIVATRRFARMLGIIVHQRSLASAGAATRLLATIVGYLFVFFGVLGVLSVSVVHLLIGAGLAGVVLGIAAQQSLGNVFAGLVLLFARPFVVGDHVQVRSGALGGIFDGVVIAISLTYVTMRIEDQQWKIPNSALLAAGVARRSKLAEH